MTLELVFPCRGTTLPTDHAYALYGALSRIVPQFHADEPCLRFAPITGIATPDGRLQLSPRSFLRVRLPDDAIKLALPLAGKQLVIGDHGVRLGVPAVRTLMPASSLHARIVTFKYDNEVEGSDGPEPFLATARAKLAELGVDGEPQLPIHMAGDRAGETQRRVVRIKGMTITGYALLVVGLSAADSMTLQARGLGGRTRMGCGWFVPAKEVK